MRTTATRRIEFDAGHRVVGHEGRCRHPHGHRYVVDVTVSADALDDVGRVVDFGAVKDAVGGWVDDNLDHAFLALCKDPLIADAEARDPDAWRVFWMARNPTAENIARLLFDVAASELPSELRVERVRVYETPNCWADYGGGDGDA